MRKTGKTDPGRDRRHEMLHIFISNRVETWGAGSTGRPVTGYEARIIDDDMKEVPRGTLGRLAVRGTDRVPLSRRCATAELCARRLEPDR